MTDNHQTEKGQESSTIEENFLIGSKSVETQIFTEKAKLRSQECLLKETENLDSDEAVNSDICESTDRGYEETIFIENLDKVMVNSSSPLFLRFCCSNSLL